MYASDTLLIDHVLQLPPEKDVEWGKIRTSWRVLDWTPTTNPFSSKCGIKISSDSKGIVSRGTILLKTDWLSWEKSLDYGFNFSLEQG